MEPSRYFLILFSCIIVTVYSFNFHSLTSHKNKVIHMSSTEPSSPSQKIMYSLKSGLRSASIFAVAVGFLGISPSFANNIEVANSKLGEYNLPPVLFVPSGFNTIVSEYGRGSIKNPIQNPILVQFCYPQNWVVQKTAVNNNGESGTIGANDYIKGDSAFLFVTPLKDNEKIDITKAANLQTILMKSLSQKGDPVETFKVKAVKPGVPGLQGQPYVIVDFEYQLNTEAGFLIGRKGVASVTSVGQGVQSLVTVTTNQRWKNLEGTLRNICDTFRINKLNSGIFATDA